MASSFPGTGCSASAEECLFSLEFLVHEVKLDSVNIALGQRPLPAVAFRFLEFPTVLLYPAPDYEEEEVGADYSPANLHLSFNRGKSCLFRQSLLSLQKLLSHTPLYILLLDLRTEVPLLLGSCLLSLSETVMLLKDVLERGNGGFSAPCWRGNSVELILHDLMGRNVGSISLTYRLLCLGGSVEGHMELRRKVKDSKPLDSPLSGSADQVFENKPEIISPTPSAKQQPGQYPPLSAKQDAVSVDVIEPIAEEPYGLSNFHQSHVPSLISQKGRCSPLPDVQATIEDLEKEASVHCPPVLYYSNSSEDKLVSEKLPTVNSSSRTNKAKAEKDILTKAYFEKDNLTHFDHGLSESYTHMGEVKNQPQQQLGDLSSKPVLSQLPLLNALLLELSVLNDHMPRSTDTISSRLAWLYTNGVNSENREAKPAPLEKVIKKSPQRLKRNKPETISRPPSSLTSRIKEQEGNKESVKTNPCETKAGVQEKKKLFYGLTNTFRLRLQHTNPNVLLEHERREQRRREQIELVHQKKMKSKGIFSKGRMSQRATSYGRKGQKSVNNNHSSIDENIETLIQSDDINNINKSLQKRGEHQHGFSLIHGQKKVSERGRNQVSKTPRGKKDYHSIEQSPSKSQVDLERNLKIHLSRSSIQSSDDCDQGDGLNSSYRHGRESSANSGTNKQHPFIGSNGRLSAELLASQDYTGYSDDFTSADFTGMYSDTFESSPEPATFGEKENVFHSYSKNSIHSSSVYYSPTPSFSAPQPTASNASPIHSYKKTAKNKKKQEIKIPISVSYDDLSDEYLGYEEESSKLDDAHSMDSEHHSQISKTASQDYTESESPEMSLSERGSSVNVSSNTSDGDRSVAESTTTKH
ncbi:microtubule-associated protein 10 [Pelodytes ibericus]